MYLYIVVESNGAGYAEDYMEEIGGVYSSLEAAKAHKLRYEDVIDRIEQWELDGVCISGNLIARKEEEEAEEEEEEEEEW